MSPGTLFALANLSILPAWILLAVLPWWKWTRVLAAYVTPAMLAGVWTMLMAGQLVPHGGGLGSLTQLVAMARDPYILVAMWMHNLMLDLFLGAWEVRDAQRLGVPHRYVVPCLALTFLAGPVGLLTYFAVRATVVKRVPWKS